MNTVQVLITYFNQIVLPKCKYFLELLSMSMTNIIYCFYGLLTPSQTWYGKIGCSFGSSNHNTNSYTDNPISSTSTSVSIRTKSTAPVCLVNSCRKRFSPEIKIKKKNKFVTFTNDMHFLPHIFLKI